jgi:hypothetical protein
VVSGVAPETYKGEETTELISLAPQLRGFCCDWFNGYDNKAAFIKGDSGYLWRIAHRVVMVAITLLSDLG